LRPRKRWRGAVRYNIIKILAEEGQKVDGLWRRFELLKDQNSNK
jgi:hypothetical protein